MRIEGVRRAATLLAGAWAVLLACVLGIGWLLTHPLADRVEPWDDAVVRWFSDHRTPGLDIAADAGSKVADTLVGIALTIVLAVAISRWQRSWRPFVYYAVLVGGTFVLYLVVTALVPRDRPPVKILDPGLIPDHSFPSGHVATSIVVYGGIALWVAAVAPRWRRWTWPLFLLPLVVAPSRLYQGAHHPTDVLTSFLFASLWLVVVSRVLLPPEAQPQNSEVPRSERGLPSGS